jgi:hypothetical protein
VTRGPGTPKDRDEVNKRERFASVMGEHLEKKQACKRKRGENKNIMKGQENRKMENRGVEMRTI